MAALTETGGEAFPAYALVLALCRLVIVGGLGTQLLRPRFAQAR